MNGMCVFIQKKIVALIKQGELESAPGLDQLWRELGVLGAWGGDRGTAEERAEQGWLYRAGVTPSWDTRDVTRPPSPLLAPPVLSPQAKPQLSAELMGLAELMLTNKRARLNARD